MKLLTHRMAGFNHLRGTFELDYGALKGLVALTGDNGQGKTSLALEGPLAGLFGPGAPTKAFASREGPLAKYATSSAAFIEDTWELADGVYRVRVNVDGVRRTTDAQLTQLLPDGTVVSHGDGKTTTFREQVAKRFPSQRSLLAGPFAGQTRRGSFGELGQKERMELFVELADLSYLEERAATCRRCADVAEAVVERLRTALATLRQEVDAALPVLVANRLEEIARAIAGQEQARTAAASLLSLAQADRDRLQLDAQRHAATSAQAQAAQADVARAEAELRAVSDAAATAAHSAAYEQVRDRYNRALAAVAQRRADQRAAHDKATAGRSERIANNRKLLDDAADITASVAATADAQAAADRARELEAEARTAHADAAQHATDAAEQLHRAQRALEELADVRRRADMLGTVKFGADCGVPPVCPLVTDAVAARDRIQELELAAAPVPELRESVSHWQAEMSRHLQQLSAAQQAAGAAARTVQQHAANVKRQPYLAAAQQRINEYEADQRAADAAQQAAEQALDAEAVEAASQQRTDLLAADDTFNAAVAANAERRAALEGQLVQLRAVAVAKAREAEALSTAPGQLQTATAACQQAQEAMALADTELAKLATERDHLHQRQAALAKLHARNGELERRLRVAEDQMLAWRALAQRLGRDGLQRLEIDAAGPKVSDLANQLLEVGWGPRFGVQIVTQVATADGKDTKEKFTIEVLDNEHGGEPRDIGDLSGGERVVVEEALRAALACYNNQRLQARGLGCRTIWRDEADGGLSEKNGPQYVQMLRKLQELSGAEQVVFITHRSELAEMADTVVVVADGAVQSVTRRAA